MNELMDERSVDTISVLKTMNQQIGIVLNEMSQIKADVVNLRDTLPLLPVDQEEVQTLVGRKIIDLLGGKKSAAYKDASVRSTAFADINRELHRQFGVRNRAAIARKDLPIVKQLIAEYDLPLALKNAVEGINASH